MEALPERQLSDCLVFNFLKGSGWFELQGYSKVGEEIMFKYAKY